MRAFLIVALAGVITAIIAVGGVWLAQAAGAERFRAETQVVLVPGRAFPPEQLSSLWEALGRGQAGIIGAEVLGQRRWVAPAAQSAGVPTQSLTLSAGAVGATTLITVSVEGPSAAAAEATADAVVREARPVVEQVSGPFALETIQSASGSATVVGADRTQLRAVAGVTGLLLGGGVALAVVRRRNGRQAQRDTAGRPESSRLDDQAQTAEAMAARTSSVRSHSAETSRSSGDSGDNTVRADGTVEARAQSAPSPAQRNGEGDGPTIPT